MTNISKLPSISDREFTRVNAMLYLFCEHYDASQGSTHDSKGFFMPTFVEQENDLVGLSIDAFYEKVNSEAPEVKKYLLEMQQIMAMLKKSLMTDPFHRTEQMFKKLNANISGSGISFPSDVAYHAGQLLRLSLFFPKHPYSYITVVSEVVRSEKAEIGYEIKCQYKEIGEETRREIIEFVKQSQNK